MIDRLKEHLENGLKTALEWKAAVEQDMAANVERLARSNGREAALRDELAKLADAHAAELAGVRAEFAEAKKTIAHLTQQIETMHDHPDVKARLLSEAEAHLAQAQARVEALRPAPVVAEAPPPELVTVTADDVSSRPPL